ncbi:hypothetical protein O0L34_g17660 [Tuta absoluta]|nr:hypothetical protein O0L34_g17660 [Tuta absoluta]
MSDTTDLDVIDLLVDDREFAEWARHPPISVDEIIQEIESVERLYGVEPDEPPRQQVPPRHLHQPAEAGAKERADGSGTSGEARRAVPAAGPKNRSVGTQTDA